MIKRLIDIFCSLIGLIVFSPIFLILSVIIICDSKGGVFFRGARVGQHNKIFYIYKFRSMLPNCEGNGKWNIGVKDPRITRIGHILRITKLDEIPQLINVFKGEMSLVGPRPELKVYTDLYTDNEKKILEMKPGITDWASLANITQYVTFTEADDPDEVYLNVLRPIKLRLQLYYYHNNSTVKDFIILFLTIYKVVTRSNYLPKYINAVIYEQNKAAIKLHKENDVIDFTK